MINRFTPKHCLATNVSWCFIDLLPKKRLQTFSNPVRLNSRGVWLNSRVKTLLRQELGSASGSSSGIPNFLRSLLPASSVSSSSDLVRSTSSLSPSPPVWRLGGGDLKHLFFLVQLSFLMFFIFLSYLGATGKVKHPTSLKVNYQHLFLLLGKTARETVKKTKGNRPAWPITITKNGVGLQRHTWHSLFCEASTFAHLHLRSFPQV